MRINRLAGVSTFLACVTILAGCGLPGGPGNFDRPAKASKMQASLVRYYNACTSPTMDSGIGTDACAVSAPSSYSFGPKGACTIKAAGVFQDPCDTGNSATCYDVKLQVKCADIRQFDDGLVVAAEDDGFTLQVVYRATMADINGDMTLIDGFLLLDLAVEDGKLSLKDTPINAALTSAYTAAAAGYAGALNLQILDAVILDPGLNIFAQMGFALN